MDVIPPPPPIPIPDNMPLAQDDFGNLSPAFDPLTNITAIRNQIRGERPWSLRDMASQWWELGRQLNVTIASGTQRIFSWLDDWQSKGQDVLLERVQTAIGHMRDVAAAAFDISLDMRVLATTMEQGQLEMEELYREYAFTRTQFMGWDHQEKMDWLMEHWFWDVYLDREPDDNWDSRHTVKLDLAFEDYWNREAQRLRDEIAEDYMESYRRLDPWVRSSDVQHHSGIAGQRIPSWQPLDYVFHPSAPTGISMPDLGGPGAPPPMPGSLPPPALTPAMTPQIPAMPLLPVAAPPGPPPLVGAPPAPPAAPQFPPGSVLAPPGLDTPPVPGVLPVPGVPPVSGVPPVLTSPAANRPGSPSLPGLRPGAVPPPGAVVDNPGGPVLPGALDISAPPGTTVAGPGAPGGPGAPLGSGPGFRMPPGMGMPPGMRQPGMGGPPGRPGQRRRNDRQPPSPGGLTPPAGQHTGGGVPPGSGSGMPPGAGMRMPPGSGAPPLRPGQQQRRQPAGPPGGPSVPTAGVPEAFLPPAGGGPPVVGNPRQQRRDRAGSAAETPRPDAARGTSSIGGGTPPVLSNQHHAGPRPTFTQQREQRRHARKERMARLRERLKSELAKDLPAGTAPVLDGRLAAPDTLATPVSGEVPPALRGARQPATADPTARPAPPADRTVRRPVTGPPALSADQPATPPSDAWEVSTPGGPVVAGQPPRRKRPDPPPRRPRGAG